MINQLELLQDIFRLSLTTAALVIPSISIAYFIMSRNENEISRMSKVIGFGSVAAFILVLCSLFTFFIIYLGYENVDVARYISASLLVLGIVILLIILIILSGIKWELPSVNRQPPNPPSREKE